MTPELWVTLIVGILGGGSLLKLISKIGDWLHHRKSIVIFSDITQIYDAMGEIVRNTKAERILVFMTHNDGQEITPVRKIYASVLYEVISRPFVSVKHKYQSLLLDGPYMKLLTDILANGAASVTVESLSEGMLKGMYVHEGVKFSTHYYLADTMRKKMWYLSIGTSHDVAEYEEYEKTIINKNVEIISKILKKYAK